MTKSKSIAVLIWAPDNPHTEQIARQLNAPFYGIHYLGYKRPILAPIKYIPQALKTWAILFRQRPSVVLVANTPVFAVLTVYIYCLLTGAKFITNVHGHSIFARKWRWSVPLQRFLAKRALVNMLDHTRDGDLYQSWGAHILLLERPPMVTVTGNGQQPKADSGQFDVTVISTFSGDEPLDLVVEAARKLPDIRFFILGDSSLARGNFVKTAPDNVIFPGYLKGEDYWNQLCNSQAVMTLTSTPHSLTSGGIETMALGKPPILSRQPALTNYFTKGAVFVDHTVESIVEGIQTYRTQEAHLTKEIVELAAEKRQRWNQTFQELQRLIGGDDCYISSLQEA